MARPSHIAHCTHCRIAVPIAHWATLAAAALMVLALPATAAAEDEAMADSAEASEYDEIANVRVLERELIPAEKTRIEQLEMGYGVDAPDRLALAGEPPVKLLANESSGVHRSSEGLQADFNEELLEALEQVETDLEPYEVDPTKSLDLPFGIDCANEESVKKYLALFTDRGSRTLKIWLKRSGRWRHMIHQVLEEEGVPADLLYLAMIESGYRPTVKSPANAGGMWQFIPGTAHDMGLDINAYVDERFDPVKATRAGARYLKKQYDRFGSWPLAMAAYNGGAGLVRRSMRTYNTNDYFKLVEYGAMYEETRRYVPRIMAAAIVGKNLEAFGFEGLQFDDPWRFDEVEVPGDVRLTLLAEAAGTDLETIEALNPELLKKQTPPDVDSYTLRIPAGTSSKFVTNYDDLAERYGDEHDTVTLKFGETMEMLAARYDVPSRVIRDINGYSRRERAPYGSEVLIPKNLKGSKKSDSDDDEEKPVIIVSSTDFELPDRKRVFYSVNHGDTLEEIASHFGVRKVQVALWNDLDTNAKLLSGLTLQLFLPQDVELADSIVQTEENVTALVHGSKEWKEHKGSSRSSRRSARSYRVKRGDTVSRIAKRYKVSIKQIIRWNNLDKNATIRPGMRLIIKK